MTMKQAHNLPPQQPYSVQQQPPPSASEQRTCGASVDLEAVRESIVDLVGRHHAEPFLRILDSVARLRADLAAAQAEKEAWVEHGETQQRALSAEVLSLRAQLAERDADLAVRDQQIAELRAVVEAARALIAAPRCQRAHMSFGHESCTPTGDGCDVHCWHVLRHTLSLAALDQIQPQPSADARTDHAQRVEGSKQISRPSKTEAPSASSQRVSVDPQPDPPKSPRGRPSKRPLPMTIDESSTAEERQAQ